MLHLLFPKSALRWRFSGALTAYLSRWANDGEHRYKVDGDVTFSQWTANMTPEQKQAFEKHVGRFKNRAGSEAKKANCSRWFDEQGNPIWPSNRGFEGEPVPQILQPGTRVDRYGYEGGTFVSPEGTPYSKRALAPGTQNKPYNIYEVVKPVEVQSGKIAPWFDEEGGGIQYEFSVSISELLEQGILKKVGK